MASLAINPSRLLKSVVNVYTRSIRSACHKSQTSKSALFESCFKRNAGSRKKLESYLQTPNDFNLPQPPSDIITKVSKLGLYDGERKLNLVDKLFGAGFPKTSVRWASTSTNLETQPQSTCKESSESEKQLSFSPDVFNFSEPVKNALVCVDPGSKYAESSCLVQFLQKAILKIGNVKEDEYSVILLNGGTSMANEATLRTLMPPKKKGKLLVLENGYQTTKTIEMCKSSNIDVVVVPRNLNKFHATLMTSSKKIAGVMTAHCDPYSGYVMPIDVISQLAKKVAPKTFFCVDADHTFGGIPINMRFIDCLISSSGNSLESAPGISFAFMKKKLIADRVSRGDSMILDLTAQYKELKENGRLLYPPAPHDINAFKVALMLLHKQGGVKERAARYRANNELLKKGMAEMGFRRLYNDAENPNGYITTAFYKPINPLFVYVEFRNRLSDYGYLISDCEFAPRNTFCICNIGDKDLSHIAQLMQAIRQVLNDMRMVVPIKEAKFRTVV